VTALDAVAAYVPAHRVPIEDVVAELGLPDKQAKIFRRFYGLAEISRDADGTLLDLLTATLARLTALRGNEHRVRYVLYAPAMPTSVPYPLNPVHQLCQRFGLDNAVAFTATHQACASALLAVDLAGRLLAGDGEPDALALVLAGEKTFTRDAKLVPETALFGEGAMACLVSAHGPANRLLSYVVEQRGEFDGRMIDDPELAARYQQAYMEVLPEVLTAAVARAGIGLADLRVILPHNVNTVSWKRVCKRIGVPVERVVLDNVPVTGHSFAADPFINYQTACDQGLLRPGDHYLMGVAGLGATFAAMVFQH
jgi:3-oxoacyl-[acyl-carrier-protein] synthase III